MDFTYINLIYNTNYQYEYISFHIGEKLLMVPVTAEFRTYMYVPLCVGGSKGKAGIQI